MWIRGSEFGKTCPANLLAKLSQNAKMKSDGGE